MDEVKLLQDVLSAFFTTSDIRVSLQRFFALLRRHMPVEALALDRFVPGQGLHIVSLVTQDGFFPIEKTVRIRRVDEEFLRSFEQSAKILHYADSEHVSLASLHGRALERYLPLRSRSYMVQALANQDRVVGHLALIGEGEHCFTPDHTKLLREIQAICSLSMVHLLDVEQLRVDFARTETEKKRLEREVFTLIGMSSIVGVQGGMRDAAANILQLIDKDTPVLVLGESGTGKELIAGAIQKNSRRSDRPFVKVSCGAIPESLLDSELFGYERGGFGGTPTVQPGKFEQAHGGTLFLDEIAELTPLTQARLLRVVQDGLLERVGGSTPVAVDVRIIAATNRDLTAMRKAGQFREDLIHRLHVYPLHLPPLRERREDIPLLIKHFSERFARRMGIAEPRIKMETMSRVMRYSWPGNIRELENLVERAMVVDPSGPLDLAAHLPREVEHIESAGPGLSLEALIDSCVSEALERRGGVGGRKSQPVGVFATLDDAAAAHITEALRLCNGKLYGPHGAARLLGINYNTLRNKMKKLHLEAKAYRRGQTDAE